MCKATIGLAFVVGLFGLAFVLGGCSTTGPGGQQPNPGVYGYQNQESPTQYQDERHHGWIPPAYRNAPATDYQQQQKEWDRSHNPYESEEEEDE